MHDSTIDPAWHGAFIYALMDRLLTDLRLALRSFAKSPGFTAAAVATLALGIGATTAVYGWLDLVLLRPLPGVARAEEVVAVETVTPSGSRIDSSYLDYRDLREGSRGFSGLIAFQHRPVAFLGREAERREALFVSENYFDVLGIRPLHGRLLDATSGSAVVLGNGFFQRAFAGNPSVVGRTVTIGGQPFVVAGVVPASFKGTVNGLAFDLYVPLPEAWRVLGGRDDRWRNRQNRWLAVMGRLAPGTSLASVRAEVDAFGRRLAAALGESNAGLTLTAVRPEQATYGAGSRAGGVFVALLGAVSVVLLIACANVANLLLARASIRSRELALRAALGAGQGRLLGQLLTESCVLSVLGGAAGLSLIAPIDALLRSVFPEGPLPISLEPRLDLRVAAFAAAVTLGTGLLCGLAPALLVRRLGVGTVLGDAGRGGSGGPGRTRLRSLLVVAETALALVLLVATGLFLRSLDNAQRVDTGFARGNVLLAGIDLPAAWDDAKRSAAYRAIEDRVARLPGVEGAAFGNYVPLGYDGGDWERVEVAGYVPARDENMRIYWSRVSPSYFSVMKVPLLAGRGLTDADAASARRVIVVNEAFTRRYLAGREPIGATVRFHGGEAEIVGVVKTGKYHGLAEAPTPFFYAPHAQYVPGGSALHLRTSVPPQSLAAAVRREVTAVDPGIAALTLTLEQVTGAAYAIQRMAARLLSALGLLALLLASVGIYGVASYSVAQRTREIGVRVALGARPADVLAGVVGGMARLTGIGLVLGALLALGATRVLAGLLIGVGAFEPLTWIAVPSILAAVAVLASLVPALRAASVDPVIALRAE